MVAYVDEFERQPVDAHGTILLVKPVGGTITLRNRVEEIYDYQVQGPPNRIIEKRVRVIYTDGDTIAVAWAPIGQIVEMSAPAIQTTFHDITPAVPGAWKRVIPGQKVAGEVSLNVLFDGRLASHKYMDDSFDAGRLEAFRLYNPDDSTGYGFAAYVGALRSIYTAGSVVVAEIILRITGEVTRTMSGLAGWPGVVVDPASTEGLVSLDTGSR